MDNKKDIVYLKHILDAARKVEKYIRDVSENDFKTNSLIQDGVIRQIEIVGEAVRRVSPGLKLRYKNVPWAEIAGMRNKLIHDYFGVDIDTVWLTAERDIPQFKQEVIEILDNI